MVENSVLNDKIKQVKEMFSSEYINEEDLKTAISFLKEDSKIYENRLRKSKLLWKDAYTKSMLE